MEGDDRTFRAMFTDEGVLRLQKQIEEKLMEFMGEYTDETLVEYVIVLLRNGRRKDEAKNELDVFLGDDSDSFVTWLWDHLGSHLSLYVQSPESQQDGATNTKSAEKEPKGSEPRQDGAIKTKSALKEPAVSTKPRQDSTTKTELSSREPVQRIVSHRIEPEPENKPSRNRHRREWKDLVRDDQEIEGQPSQSSLTVHVNDKHDAHRKSGDTRRLLSPRQRNQKKKRRSEERQPIKREIPQIPVGGARRLLQFAVRDAVKPSNTSTEPSMKRLRSVVSTTVGHSLHEEFSNRNRSRAGFHADMSAAIKAAAEAVQDVNDGRSSRNIYDRLGYPHDIVDMINNEEDSGRFHADMSAAIKAAAEAVQDVNDGRSSRNIYDRLGYPHDIVDMINNEEDSGRFAEGEVVEIFSDQRDNIHFPYHEEHEIILPQDMLMSLGDTLAPELVYDAIESRGEGVLGTSDMNWVDDSLLLPPTGAQDFDGREHDPYNDLDQPADAYHSSVEVASSIDVDAWRTSKYDNVTDVYVTDHCKSKRNGHTSTDSESWLMKENSNPVLSVNGNAKHATDPGHEFQETRAPAGIHSTGPPTEDANVRTIYVSNVHFAATNDCLSQHFNKFGEVLKVILLTDPNTGLLKGSAYIEFMRKEAAESSLSLNGTSFMSRILKVAWKSSEQSDAAPTTPWPARAARATPYPFRRFSRATTYARGVPSVYRPRGSVKPGRSFQWTRGAQISGTDFPGQASNSVAPTPLTRSLTYVRRES